MTWIKDGDYRAHVCTCGRQWVVAVKTAGPAVGQIVATPADECPACGAEKKDHPGRPLRYQVDPAPKETP